MLPKVESACFVIADFSGYTNFVSGVELDHAQDIIADIMETLLRALRPTFRLAKFEGDAAFVYAVGDEADGDSRRSSGVSMSASREGWMLSWRIIGVAAGHSKATSNPLRLA